MKNKKHLADVPYIDSSTINETDMGDPFRIKNIPNSNDLWRGIGGHFDSLSQIIHEFVDNAISNFIGNSSISKNIVISFIESGKNVEVIIEDQGTGIKDLDAAFCLGNKTKSDSPLNEHGFGMKHALASANPDNNNWAVFTRTEPDFKKGEYKKIQSPYRIFDDFGGEVIKEKDERWPGQYNGSGTLVRFECTWEMFATLRKGIKGTPLKIDGFMEYFREDLGFIYSNILKSGVAITIISPKNRLPVAALEPDYNQPLKPRKGVEKINLGSGDVEIHFNFTSINEPPEDRYKYYKKNTSSSGLEIRINGRLLAYNLFKDIWNLEPHPQFNHLLVQLNLVSDDPKKLPSTRTSKNGIREGDGKLEAIYEWVRKKYDRPTKDPDILNENQDEINLFEDLAEQKRVHIKGSDVTTQKFVFHEINENTRIDLYIHHNGYVTIYEGKKDKTTFKDVYQLRMYWDGCIIDGITPNEGIIISASHPKSVKELVKIVNEMKDGKGNNYNFIIKYWKDENVTYPK